MPQPLINIIPLLPHLESGHLIFTPNSRLKNKLIQAYNQHQQSSGKRVWKQPNVYAIRDWLNLQYDNLVAAAKLPQPAALANNEQLQQLWLQVIESDTKGLELVNPLRLASDANSAYSTLLRWDITLDEVVPETEQQRQFLVWARDVEERLQHRGLLTHEQLQQCVNQALHNQLIPPAATLLLLDFDELTPLLENTFALLSDTRLMQRSSVTSEPQNQLREYADKEQEVIHAAQWAKQKLQDNPAASIGLIVPNLGQERALLARHLTEVFEPHYLAPQTPRYTLPFNFSTGTPLGSAPVIQAALRLLKLGYRQWDLHQLIELLHSPFLGQSIDLEFTEQLCNDLLKRGRHQISTQRLRRRCQELADKNDQAYGLWLSNALHHGEELRRRSPSRQSASRWAHYFIGQLQQFGWPGARRADSNEFQQVQQFYNTLEAFSRLDELDHPLSLHEALDLLSRQLNSTPYQAQTPESPIQVLGALEGAGLLFNHCWVMGMNHREWPPAPQPNPLLPLVLQRDKGMPHADAERELRYAEALTQGYAKAAADVVFSYARQGEESQQQASPLLRHLVVERHTENTDTAVGHYAQQQINQPQEWYDTQTAPPLSDIERARLTGGSQILRNQAVNPMAAFLIHRLGARQPTPLHHGFSPQQRGQILHEALANLWQQWQRQTALIELPQETLAEAVTSEVERQTRSLQHREPNHFSDRYIALENKRLSNLILGWLDQEKQRPGFTVHATEASLKTEIAGLPLTLRLDRLDLLDNGQWLIIDYKTGTPNLKSLGSERPEEPQLPIYAIAYEHEIAALLFVQINASETTIKGVGALSDFHEGVVDAARGQQFDLPDNWPDTLEHWREHLNSLATEFQQGHTFDHFKYSNLQRFYDYLTPLLRPASIRTDARATEGSLL